MGLEFKIYHSEGTGQSGVGGGPTLNEVTNIMPTDLDAPYRGQGASYVYKKYFLNITQYDDTGNAPVLSNLLVSSITSSGALVTWTTDVSGTSVLDYGTSTSYTSQVSNGALLNTSHSLSISDLSNDTLYYIKARSAGIEGIESFLTATFNTLDIVAPVISNLRPINVTSTTATVIWDTNESSTGTLQYGVVYTDNSINVSDYDTSYSIPISGLSANTTYQYRATVGDDSGNTSASNVRTFGTASGGGPSALTISSVVSGSITASSAIITWTTNNPASTIVAYSTNSGSFNQLYRDDETSTTHTGTLTNLNDGLRYYFYASGVDIYDQYASSDTYYFDTTDETAPIIAPGTVTVGETSATVLWDTNELADTVIHWGTSSTSLTSTGGVRGVYTSGHTGTMTPLAGNTQYYYQMIGFDSAGNSGEYPVQNLTTSDAGAPVISSLVVTPNYSGCAVSWLADESSLGVVSWGSDETYALGSAATNQGNYTTSHSTLLRPLINTTFYTYKVECTDVSDNMSTSTGTFTTLAPPGGSDTTAPLITNIQVPLGSITSNSASVLWETDEPATSSVEYTSTAFPGISGEDTTLVTDHTFNISNLSADTEYEFYVASKDADDNNRVVYGGTFTTEAVSSSAFSDGDVVSYVEYTVMRRPIPSIAQWQPVRAIIPVQDDQDISLPWAVYSNGLYMPCQREVTKRRADGQAALVEIVFPVWIEANATVSEARTAQVIAKESVTGYSWSTETISDFNININLPDGRIHAVPCLSSNISTKQVRGDGNSPWCRTYRYFSRFTNTTNSSDKSMVAHIYVTYYNYAYFPNAKPVVDIRLSNGQLNTSAPTSVGRIYFRTIAMMFPAIGTTVTHKITPSILWNSMATAARQLTIAKTLADTSTSTGDTTDNAFAPGTQLQRRFALYAVNSNSAIELESYYCALEYADLRNVGFAVPGTWPVGQSTEPRSWTTIRAHGPHFVMLPSYSTTVYSSFTGRDAVNRRYRVSASTLKSNMGSGGYTYDAIVGAAQFSAPYEFGPWRPWYEAGGATPGGAFLGTNNCAGYCQEGLITEMYLMMMKTSTWFYCLWNLADGEPVRVENFLNANNKLSYSVALNGRIGARTSLPYLCVGGDSDSEPTPFNTGSCSYLGSVTSIYSWDVGGLKYWTAIDDQHFIRYMSSFISVAEVSGDRMAIDDILNAASAYRYQYCRYGSSSYSLGYSIYDNYYGYSGINGASPITSVISDPHKGRGVGRGPAWTLFLLTEAYTLAKDTARTDLAGDLNLWMLYLRDVSVPLGTPDKWFWHPTIPSTHPGIKCNGQLGYLNYGVASGIAGHSAITVAAAGTTTTIGTGVTSAAIVDLASFISTWGYSEQDSNTESIHYSDYEHRIQAGNFTVNARVGVSNISFDTRLIAEVYVYDTNTGVSTLVASGQSLPITYLTSTSLGNISFNVVIPSDVPLASNSSKRLKVKLRASTTSASTITLSVFYNGSQTYVDTRINSAYKSLYGYTQLFETIFILQSKLALCKSYAEAIDTSTNTTLLNNIKTWYDQFYKVSEGLEYLPPPLIGTAPGAFRDYSSFYRSPDGAGGFKTTDCFVTAVSKNPAQNSGDGETFTTMINEIGRYSDDPDFNYYSFGILCAMLANEDLGTPFDINGVLANRWRLMGSRQYLTPLAKATDYITNGLVSPYLDTYGLDSWFYLSQMIAHLQYWNTHTQASHSSSTTLPGIRLFLLDASNPESVELGTNSDPNDSLSGSVFQGDQRSLQFSIGSGDPTTSPEFSKARGANQAIYLYNRDGIAGGDVVVGEDTDTMIPFWLRVRLDENQVPKDSSYIRLGVIAGDGPIDGAASASTSTDDDDGVSPLYDPTNDFGYYEGETLGGLNSARQLGNILSFFYVGDENIKYTVNMTPGQPAYSGLLHIYEEYSDSYPATLGGIVYKSTTGTNFSAESLATYTALTSISQISPLSYAADFTTTLDGTHQFRHEYTISGKGLKVRTYSLNTNITGISGNYYSYSPGLMSGVEGPAVVNIPGLGRIPTICFDGPSTDKYFMSAVNDLTKSNCQVYQQTAPNSVVPGVNTVSWSNNMTYAVTTDRINLPATVDETTHFIVSKKFSDVLWQYHAPTSEYLDTVRNKHVFLLSAQRDWTPDTPTNYDYNAWSNYIKKMKECGADDVIAYTFYTWTNWTGTRYRLDGITPILLGQNAGPSWYPAYDDAEFRTMLTYANSVNWPVVTYQMYNYIWSGNDINPFTTGDIAVNSSNQFKRSVNGTPHNAYSGQYDYLMPDNKALPFAIEEATRLKTNYNFSGMFYDVFTYDIPGNTENNLDARPNSRHYTNKESIANRKTQFLSLKDVYNGPILGEGSIAVATTEQDHVWAAYIESSQGHVNTHTTGTTLTLPSGSIGAPSRFPLIPEYQFRISNKRQTIHGLGFPDRFFSYSDADAKATSPDTPVTSVNEFFPYSRKALDRYRTFEIGYGRAGYTQPNGYFTGIGGGDYEYFWDQVGDYYIMNELQRRYLGANVQNITYRMSNGAWSGFDAVMAAKKNITGFSGAAIHYEFDTGFEMWVNPYPTAIGVDLVGWGQDDGNYELRQDSWLAVAPDGFINFSAITTTSRGDTDGERADYCYAPGRYEYFDGRSGSACVGFGNIITSGNNLRLIKCHNFINNNTVMRLTDGSVAISGGLV